MIVGRISNPSIGFMKATVLRRVIRDISEQPEGSGIEDDARALELQSEMGKISEIVLTQVNTSDGEDLTFFFLGGIIALIIVALVVIGVIICELRRPPPADGRRDSRSDEVIVA
ncbi:unnamed protein product [Oikopleura dioica]|uniref:Uncharacterized protein n=1 Tax=Oikopleura dioica TaxID=34765 RepID=E4WYW1_OIKDI|nr:unnamed protein product [Oikopleura dioica]